MVGIQTVNATEVLALCDHRLRIHHIKVEGDYFCAISWSNGQCRPWLEVRDLDQLLQASFSHVNHGANNETSLLAK